jgi:hypothetical protein
MTVTIFCLSYLLANVSKTMTRSFCLDPWFLTKAWCIRNMLLTNQCMRSFIDFFYRHLLSSYHEWGTALGAAHSSEQHHKLNRQNPHPGAVKWNTAFLALWRFGGLRSWYLWNDSRLLEERIKRKTQKRLQTWEKRSNLIWLPCSFSLFFLISLLKRRI